MQSLRVSARIRAPRDAVWQAITHHEGMVDWSPLRRVTLVREGAPDRDGLGAIRRMEAPGMRLEEEVVSWNPTRSYEYRVVRGAPVKDHRGSVSLADARDATDVTWSVEFRPVVPGTGWILKLALTRGLKGMLSRLKKNLE